MDPNVETLQGESPPLVLAAMSNDIELIGLLLEAGGDIDASDVLAKAAGEEENFEILNFLIEQGADVEISGVDALKS